MNEIKDALAQLRAARNAEETQVPDNMTQGHAVPEAEPLSAEAPVSAEAPASRTQLAEPGTATRGQVKTLAGRVPLSLHRELTRALLDAADELRVSRINVDEALEAAMRVVLRDTQATQLWYAQLKEVRRGRREG